MPQMRRFGLATCLQGYIMWAWECEPRCQLCSLLDSTCNCCNTVSPAGPAYSYPRLVSRPHPSFLSSAVCKAAVKAVECSLFGSTWSWASSEVIRHSSIRGWKSHSIPMQDIFLSLLHLSPTRTNIHSHTKLTHKTHISPPPPLFSPQHVSCTPTNTHSLFPPLLGPVTWWLGITMRLTGLEKSQKGHQPAANTQHTDEQGKEEGGDDRRGESRSGVEKGGKVSQEWKSYKWYHKVPQVIDPGIRC